MSVIRRMETDQSRNEEASGAEPSYKRRHTIFFGGKGRNKFLINAGVIGHCVLTDTISYIVNDWHYKVEVLWFLSAYQLIVYFVCLFRCISNHLQISSACQ